MSTQQTHGDVDAASYFLPPDPSLAGEELFSIFGVNSTLSRNLSAGGEPLVVKGTGPTFAADNILASIDNTYKLPGDLTEGIYTLLLVFKLVPGGSGAAARIIWCQPLVFITLTLTPAGLLTLFGAGLTAPNATLQINGSLDRYIAVSCQLGGGATRIRNLTDGTESTDGGSGGTVTAFANVFLELVGGPSGSNTWQTRFSAAVKLPFRATDEQIDNYYAYIKAFLLWDRDQVC